MSLSTMEAKSVAALQAGSELLGLKVLFDELGIPTMQPMMMLMDN